MSVFFVVSVSGRMLRGQGNGEAIIFSALFREKVAEPAYSVR